MYEQSVEEMIQEEKTLFNFKFPKVNSKGRYELTGEKNKYIFDFQLGETGVIVISKALPEIKQKYQLRLTTPIVRVDLNAPPHMCNDGQMWKNHIHVLQIDKRTGREEYKTYKLEMYSPPLFADLNGRNVITDFFKLCNIKLIPSTFVQEII